MKKLLTWLLALACVASAWAAGPVPHKDPFRGDAAFSDEVRPPVLQGAENRDQKRVRSFAMQPPTIPHAIDNYQLDRFANKCMTCHSRAGAGASQATPVSVTHYTDREGNFLADIAPRRYFCDTCHVVQMNVEPKVANTFEDVETIVRRKRVEVPAGKVKPAAVKK